MKTSKNNAQPPSLSLGRGLRRAGSLASRGGQFAVEMAMATPLLVILLLGTADLSRVYFVALALNSAARAGVQYGAQNATTAADITGMQTAATNDAAGVAGISATAKQYCQCPGGSPFSCGVSNACSDKRVYVEVDTTGSFNTLFRYPGIPNSVNLTGKAVMREQ